MLKQVLKVLEQSPFSAKEMMRLVEGKANLVTYPDISKYNSIDELLGEYGACIILYITDIKKRSNVIMGHWVTLFKTPYERNTLEFFDPYALMIDQEFNFTKHKYPPYLTNLLEQCNYNIIYNTHVLQNRKNSNVSTCGRHVGVRLCLRNIPLPVYSKMLNSCKDLSPDDLVTLMTGFLK